MSIYKSLKIHYFKHRIDFFNNEYHGNTIKLKTGHYVWIYTEISFYIMN